MKRSNRILAWFLILNVAGLCSPEIPTSHAAGIYIPITAPSAVLLDASTQRFVYSKTPNLRRPPASTTKVLTAIVAADMLNLNSIATIPAYVEKIPPSKIYLRRGEKFYVRDLIRSILLNSANDSAEALAFAAAGSRAAFAARMNAKARKIGARHSNFVNPHGLPDSRQYSTAYDLSLIMNEAQKYPFIVETMKIKTMQIRSVRGRRIYLRNHNKMLWQASSRPVIGKTGWTRAARHCFVGRISVNGRQFFVALMGSHRLWVDLKKLIDYKFGTALLANKQKRNVTIALNDKRQIQIALRKAGYYSGPLNGHIGPITTRSLKRFQKAKGLQVDGVVGPKTWAKLKPYL